MLIKSVYSRLKRSRWGNFRLNRNRSINCAELQLANVGSEVASFECNFELTTKNAGALSSLLSSRVAKTKGELFNKNDNLWRIMTQRWYLKSTHKDTKWHLLHTDEPLTGAFAVNFEVFNYWHARNSLSARLLQCIGQCLKCNWCHLLSWLIQQIDIFPRE